jgi:hypothetical protein
MILDHDVTYKVPNLTKIFVDTETTSADGEYVLIPKPTENGHMLTIIQLLIQTPGKKPQIYIFHR